MGRQIAQRGRGKRPAWQWLYVPTPKQVEFDACPAKYVLYGGAAGPGKSHAARWALYRRCLRLKNYRALLLRRTYPELESTHLDKMAMDAELIGAVFTKSERTLSFPSTGALIRCGHMDDAAAVQKYLSTEYDMIVPDEGSTYDPESLLELSTRARTSNPAVLAEGGAKFWIPSNPGGPSSSMLLDFFIDHQPDTEKYPALVTEYRPDEWVYLPATLDDNPYIDPAYVRQLATLTKWRYDQLRHGDWRVFSGQFFTEWQERLHVAVLEPSRTESQWFRSLDWGRNQPGCVLWWAMLPDHQLYVRKEWKFQGMSEQEVGLGIARIDAELGLAKVTYTAADPAIFNKTGATHTDVKFVGQSIGESLNYYGLKLIKADNDRFNGWGRCHALLRPAPDGVPWVRVHPDCRYLLRSIAGAVSDDKNPDDVDTKSDDHALDAWRYGAMSRPHPLGTQKTRRHFPEGTMGALRQMVTCVSTRLGSESTRRAVA
jgi:phage terminase large subunit